jgi:hypothetical protein
MNIEEIRDLHFTVGRAIFVALIRGSSGCEHLKGAHGRG